MSLLYLHRRDILAKTDSGAVSPPLGKNMFLHKRCRVLVIKPSFWPKVKGVFAKDFRVSLDNVRIGSDHYTSGRMPAEQVQSSRRDIARYDH